MRNWTMRDVFDLMDREVCSVEVCHYLDERDIVFAKGDKTRAWKWNGAAWVAATADDTAPTPMERAIYSIPRAVIT